MARIRTQGSRLRVRSGPGESFPVVGWRNNGDTVSVMESQGGWARIGTGQWVAQDYVRTSGSDPDVDTLDGVIEHPARPGNPRWRLLIGFAPNSAVLRESHRAWLSRVPVSQARFGQYIYVRGMASRLGTEGSNLVLSRRRAQAVSDFLVTSCHVPQRQITGIEGIGEVRARGSETEDDARSRAVEVIITNNTVELPPAFIQGQSPLSTVFYLKYLGGGGASFAGAGEEEIAFAIRTNQDYWQKYLYVGVGGSLGPSPASWGEGLPAGAGWVRFTTRTPMRGDAFAGQAAADQLGVQAGARGFSGLWFHFNLISNNPIKGLRVPTGPGLSIGVSGTKGRLITRGALQHSGRWRLL